MSIFIDRRKNDRDKSLVNRRKFIKRYHGKIREAIDRSIIDRSIKDMQSGGSISISTKGIDEPSIHHGPGGDHERVYPGNDRFSQGDHIKRPLGGAGEGGNGSGEGDGDVMDSFRFVLSREEFMKLFFDDLELPNLERTILGETSETRLVNRGFTKYGTPARLSVKRSVQQGIKRQTAIQGAIEDEIDELKKKLESATTTEERETIENEIRDLEHMREEIPFIDEVDLRYRNRTIEHVPIFQAVMFCLMDVSASMDEEKKDLAKRFFTLLHLFLERKYEKVEVVFIRHTDDAEEVDEQTFFHDTKSGGTVVLSALTLMRSIIEARYPLTEWNIYGAQASDGDAFGADPEKSASFLKSALLPMTQYFAYIELPDNREKSILWRAYQRIYDKGQINKTRFALRRVNSRKEIYPVLRGLFRKANA